MSTLDRTKNFGKDLTMTGAIGTALFSVLHWGGLAHFSLGLAGIGAVTRGTSKALQSAIEK